MPSECKFTFYKGCETFFHGENIEGTISLTNSKGKTIKAIYVFLTGERKIKWPDPQYLVGDNAGVDQGRNHFWSYEKIKEVCIKLKGDGVLAACTHTYFFSFRPEINWPTSIEGKYGFIRYELSLVIERRYSHNNVFKKPLTIIRPFDLNLNQNYKNPVVSEVNVTTCCSAITKCKLYCILSTAYGAYTPGQILRYNVEIHNTTGKTIHGFTVKFIKKITYVATRPSLAEQIVETDLISKYIQIDPVPHNTIADEFSIPSTPPTSFNRTTIFVEYFLKVQADLSCCFSTNLEAEVKLIIGTVPLIESLAPCQLEEDNEEAAAQGPAPSNRALNNHGIKPPTFAMDVVCETPFIDTDVEEIHRIVGYRPQYPVYIMPLASSLV